MPHTIPTDTNRNKRGQRNNKISGFSRSFARFARPHATPTPRRRHRITTMSSNTHHTLNSSVPSNHAHKTARSECKLRSEKGCRSGAVARQKKNAFFQWCRSRPLACANERVHRKTQKGTRSHHSSFAVQRIGRRNVHFFFLENHPFCRDSLGGY